MHSHDLSLERLESRVAPAGLINVAVSSGVLQLKSIAGSDGDEVVTVSSQSDGSYLLTPGAGVLLRIGGADLDTPQAIRGVTKGMQASLGAGDDSLTLNEAQFTGAISVQLGTGDNTFTLQDSRVGSGVKVLGGDGTDTISITGSLVLIDGGLQAILGPGTDAVVVSAFSSSIGGNVKIDLGTGADTVTVNNNREVSVNGSLTITGGEGVQNVQLGVDAFHFTVVGALVVNLGEGNDKLTLGSEALTLRSALLNLGNGSNTLTVGETDSLINVHRDFKVLAGNGDQLVTVDAPTANFGSVQFSLGIGDHAVNFVPPILQVRGDLRWTSADGNAEFISQKLGGDPNTWAIGGNVLTKMGNGVSNFRINGSAVAVEGKIDIRAGNSPTATGRLLVGATFFDVGGSVYIQGGANTFNAGVFSSETRIAGNITVLTGPGSNFTEATIQGPSSILGNVLLKTTNTDGFVRADFRDAVVRGSVTAIGGTGVGFSPGVVLGAVKLVATSTIDIDTGGRMLRMVDISLNSADGATGTVRIGESFLVQDTIFEGGLKIRGGAGNDTVRINDTAVLGSTLIDMGAGNDSLSIEIFDRPEPTTFAGPVRFVGGTGNDFFSLGANGSASRLLQFLAAVIVDGGAGEDTLNIANSTTFAVTGDPVKINIP
jgi:hypothetical protein